MQIGRYWVQWIGYPFESPRWLFRRFPAGWKLVVGPLLVWRMRRRRPDPTGVRVVCPPEEG